MKKSIYIISLIWISLTSCSNFLEEYSQDLVKVQSYQDLDEILIGSTYMKVFENSGNGTTYYGYIHFMADEAQENLSPSMSYATDCRSPYFGYYTWQKEVGMNSTGTLLNAENKDWDRIYKHINLTNMILTSLKSLKADTPQDEIEMKRIAGEAHFLRAAYYFTLVNLYGKPYQKTTSKTDLAIPLKLTDYVEDREFNRNSVEEVYQQIILDLSTAEVYLEGVTRKSIYRADITAVNLLQSRVYLYMQNWGKATYYADQVMKRQPNLIDLNSFATSNSFLSATSAETIFSMGGSSILIDLDPFAYQMWPFMKTQTFDISDDLFATYADDDLRKTVFVSKKSGIGTGYTKLNKNISGPGSKCEVSDKFLFRTAEAYLNKAEALCYTGDEDGARIVLNEFRSSRMKGNKSEVSETGEKLANIIRDERRREFCLEGHRWFDLRRYQVCEKYPFTKTIRNSFTLFNNQPFKPIETRIYELKENDPAYTLPIPWEVLNYNTSMQNNDRDKRDAIEIITYK